MPHLLYRKPRRLKAVILSSIELVAQVFLLESALTNFVRENLFNKQVTKVSGKMKNVNHCFTACYSAGTQLALSML